MLGAAGFENKREGQPATVCSREVGLMHNRCLLVNEWAVDEADDERIRVSNGT